MAEYTLAENPFPIGSSAPYFNLKGVDGEMHSLDSFTERILMIAFICNHCPYVQAYLERFVNLQDEFSDKGVRFIGINPNDASRYPDDSYEMMVEMAQEKNLNFPYLRDEDQSVADAYHAERTPQIFVFDEERKLRYIGGIDDSYNDPGAVKERLLHDALEALVEGRDVPKPEAPSIGCSVKWVE